MAYETPPFDSKTRRRMGTRTINYENWYNNVNNPYAYLYGIDDSPLMQFETLQGEPVERIKIDTQPNQFQIDFTDADQMIDENLYNPASEPPEYSASGQQSNSKLNWKGIGDLAITAAGHIADIVNSTKSTITIPKYTNYHADSINDLSDLGNMHKTYLNKDTLLQKPTAKTFFGDFFKKSTEGAIAGSSLGPWGILGGAIGGGLASIGNIAAKRSTYNKDLNAISRFNRLENIAFNDAYNTGLNNIIDNKNHSMYKQRLIGNYNAAGGPLGSEEQMGVTTFNTGGTHEMNQNGGIPQGIGDNGNVNLVEEGEVKWNDFIFSNRIQPSGDILSKYNTAFNKQFNSYADAANFILDLHKERENNPFDKSTLNVQMQRLADAQEYQKLSDEAAQYGLTPEEYVEYQQQAQNVVNQNSNANSFDSGGDKDKKKPNNYTYMGTLDLAQNGYITDNNGNGYYLHLPGVGQDSSGLKGPTKETRSFAKSYPTLAYHLANFIRNDYLLQRIGANVANATNEYTREMELERYKKQEARYNYSLQRAVHIISFLHARDEKFKNGGVSLMSRALNYLQSCGPHWSQNDFNALRSMLDNPQVTNYYLKKSGSLLISKLNSKDAFGTSDPDVIGKHSEFKITTTSDLPTITTRSANNITTQTNTSTNISKSGTNTSVNYGYTNTGKSTPIVYYNPQSTSGNGTLGSYNTNGDGYKITGTGGGSGNKQYRGDIDYNDPANKQYDDISNN